MASVDLSDPGTYTGGMPHALFRRLRDDDPVSRQIDGAGAPFWAVTRYDDVVAVLRDPERFSSFRGGIRVEDPPPPVLDKIRMNLLNRDPPDHTRMRRLVGAAFAPRRLAALDAAMAARARSLVQAVLARGECDFATEIAGEMPLFVICELLGVPLEDRQRLYALTERMLGSAIIDRDAAMRDAAAAADSMREYGAWLAGRKRDTPGEDLVSDLVRAGAPPSDIEMQAWFMLLFNAGSDTTRSLLCFGLDLLVDHPDVAARLAADESLLPGAIEEFVRLEPPMIHARRTATRATTLGERSIADGDRVVVFFPSAHRDERAFDEPDRLVVDRIHRAPNPHLGFGQGIHFCLGATLARLESRHVLRELLASVTDLSRARPMILARTNFIRGVRHQEIRFRVR